MNDTRGDRRADTARRNDDSDIIEEADDLTVAAAEQQGAEGGNLQRDIGTQAGEARAIAPAAHENVKKGDHIAHGHGESPRHPPEKVVSERD